MPPGGETIKNFAPFSHDAQTAACTVNCGSRSTANVPEPASLLLGAGLLVVAQRVRRQR